MILDDWAAGIRAAWLEDLYEAQTGNKTSTPESSRRAKSVRLFSNYGITLAEYEQMYKKQEGACAICNQIAEILDIDHCHRTHTVRGLLCNRCNQALGLFKEDIKILEAALAYLKVPRPKPDLATLLLMASTIKRGDL